MTIEIMRRGLRKFVSETRSCSSKDAEQRRVDKELQHIRKKYKGNKSLNTYEKKKYVLKLLYAFMLGYRVEFGFKEMLSLACSPVPAEKQVGYAALSMIIGENNEWRRLSINMLRTDLRSKVMFSQVLAVNFLTNVGNNEIFTALSGDVLRLLGLPSVNIRVKKKALLCCVRMRKHNCDVLSGSDWAGKLVPMLEQKNEFGVTLCTINLLNTLAEKDAPTYEGCVPLVISMLEKIILKRVLPQEYFYHEVPSPFLQIKLFRFLQFYEVPTSAEARRKLFSVLEHVLEKRTTTKLNKIHSLNAIITEATNLLIAYGKEADFKLLTKAIHVVSQFIASSEPNTRTLGLTCMARIADSAVSNHLEPVLGLIRMNQGKILSILKEDNDTNCRMSLGILFVICNQKNMNLFVREILQYLRLAEPHVKKDSVKKLAKAVEEHLSVDHSRVYVDTLLKLAFECDFLPDNVWMRLVSTVRGRSDLENYCATSIWSYIQSSHLPETFIKISAHMLGEFGHQLVTNSNITPPTIFNAIDSYYCHVAQETKTVILEAYARLVKLYPVALGDAICERHPSIKNPHGKIEQTIEMPEQTMESDMSILSDMSELDPKIHVRYASALLHPNGLLYEDDILQVGMQRKVEAGRVTLSLSYGNKTGDQIDDLSVKLLGIEEGLSVHASKMQKVIYPRLQVAQKLKIRIKFPFKESPMIQLCYSHAQNPTSTLVNIRLPVAVTSFSQPLELSHQDFLNRWGNGVGIHEKGFRFLICSASKPSSICKLLSSLNMSAKQFEESRSKCLFGSGRIQSGDGECASRHVHAACGYLVRMDISSAFIDVFVRSTNNNVVQGVVNVLDEVLSQVNI